MNISWDISPYKAASTASSSRSTAERTAGNDTSSFFTSHDDSEPCMLISKHWIRVSQLEANTTDAALKKMFYPYGGDEAFTFWDSGCLSGFVGFEMEEMANLAAEKMNAFIPCRQTQALAVSRASLEEVIVVRARASVAAASTPAAAAAAAFCAASPFGAASSFFNFAPAASLKSFLTALYSDCTEREVAAAVERCSDTVACAAEMVAEVGRASVSTLQRIMTSLTELSPNWAAATEFREQLLKQLLRSLLEDNGRCALQATNCGVAIGNMFAMRIISGDPFQLATRILERGVTSVPQADGICMIAHVCGSLPFPISKASFWALVGQCASHMPPGSSLASSLLGHLRQLSVCPQQSQQQSSVDMLLSGSDDFAITPLSPMKTKQHQLECEPTAQQQEESKRRTVYVSHLPTVLPQKMLMDLLVMAGPVNKVRVCAGNGYSTLFAFVEMQTLDGASAAMRLNGAALFGHTVRVQPARNPIQDVLDEDAVYGPNGATVQMCLFGTKMAPLSMCVSQTTPKTWH